MLYFENIKKGGKNINNKDILPESINLNEKLQNTLGDFSGEFAAMEIIKFCLKEPSGWKGFTFEDICNSLIDLDKEGSERLKAIRCEIVLMPGLRFLKEYGWVRKGEEGLFWVTEDLKKRCYERHPAYVKVE